MIRRGYLREVVTGVLALVMGTILLKYADIPSRVSVLESNQANTRDTLGSMDSKIDLILQKLK